MAITATESTTTTSATVSARKLSEALAVVAPFAESGASALPALAGVRFIPGGDSLVIVATDRYTLGEYTVPASDDTTADGEAFTLPNAAVKEWLKHLKQADRYNTLGAEIAVRDGYVTLTVGAQIAGMWQVGADEWAIRDHGRLFPADVAEPLAVTTLALGANVLRSLAKAFVKNTALDLYFSARPNGPITLTARGHENFRGLVMPLKPQS